MSRALTFGSLIVLAGLAVGAPGKTAADAADRRRPDTGTDPGKQVPQWIKIAYWGSAGRPMPIINISPQRFPVRPAARESLIVLPERQYRALSEFTRSQPCTPVPGPAASREFDGGSLVESRDGGNPVPCVMPHVTACGYLHSITALPGIRWTATDLEPVRELVDEMKCGGL